VYGRSVCYLQFVTENTAYALAIAARRVSGLIRSAYESYSVKFGAVYYCERRIYLYDLNGFLFKILCHRGTGMSRDSPKMEDFGELRMF
jgi:hypothetical protein